MSADSQAGTWQRTSFPHGWDVAGTIRDRPSGIRGVTEYQLEIDDEAALLNAVSEVRPTHVFHLAAIVDSVSTPDVLTLYRTNILGTAALSRGSRPRGWRRARADCQLVLRLRRTAAGGRPVCETDALAPTTPYGASKVASEAIALQWGRSTGVDVVVTRAFQHTGPGHVGPYALSDWAKQLAAGATEIRVGNLDVARDYLDVRDVVTAYVSLILTGRAGCAYNVASGVPVTMRTLLQALIEAFGSSASIVVDPRRLRSVDHPVFVADVTRLREDVSFLPRYSLRRPCPIWLRGGRDRRTDEHASCCTGRPPNRRTGRSQVAAPSPDHGPMCQAPTSARSASTISLARSGVRVCGFQPRASSALE